MMYTFFLGFVPLACRFLNHSLISAIIWHS